MTNDDLKKRIEALNKKPLKNVPDEPSEIAALRGKPVKQFAKPVTVRQPAAQTQPSVTLEEAIEGVLTDAPAGPGYYLVEKPATELEAEASLIHQ